MTNYKKEYSAYKNGTSTVIAAPNDVLGQRYIRDKVGDVITYTPIEVTQENISQIATVVTARPHHKAVVLAIWQEYRGMKFERTVSREGIIQYTEVNK